MPFRERLLQPGEILTELLSKPPYREMWGQYVQRRRGNGVNVRAVATFMAGELSDAAGQEMNPSQFKDSVRRALAGELVTDRTLNRFIVAFGFTPQETQDLWVSLVSARKRAGLYPSPDLELPSDSKAPSDDRVVLAQQIILNCDEYGLGQTMDVTETYLVKQDNLTLIRPVIEGHELQFEVLEGGEVTGTTSDTTLRIRDKESDIVRVYIKTPRPLRRGEIHRTRLLIHLTDTPEKDQSINFFRVGSRNNPKYEVTTIIRFKKAPEYITHCVWDELFEQPVLEEYLTPGHTHYSMYYPIMDQAFCGFRWPIVTPPETE